MREVQRFTGHCIQALESRILLAAPVNDTWEQATVLDPVFNVVEGSLADATTDGGVSGTSFSKNLWYKYVSPVNTVIEYSIEGADLRLWRVDSTSHWGPGTRGSQISVTAQQTYYVEVIPMWASKETEFELRLNAVGLGAMPQAPDQIGSTYTDNEFTIRWKDWNPYTATGHQILRRFGAERTILTAEESATSFTDAGATPGIRYTYAVLTRTAEGTSVWSDASEWGPRPINDTPDEALEIDPAGGIVSGFAMTADQVWHTWTPSYTGEVEIEASGVTPFASLYEQDEAGTLVMLAAMNGNPIGPYAVQAGKPYWLSVSAPSAEGYTLDLIRVGGTEGAPRMPWAPQVSRTGEAVHIQWTDESDNETGFMLERRVNWGDWQTIQSLPAGAQAVYDFIDMPAPTALHYRITAVNALASRTSASSDVLLVEAPNDSFQDALEVSGQQFAVETDLTSCTFEADEIHYLGTGSVWYKWTAPASGKVTWAISDGREPYYGPRLEPFTGDSLATLLPVGTGDRTGSKQFTAIAGKQYYLQVMGEASRRITMQAQLTPAEPPAVVVPEFVELRPAQFQIRWADTWDDETGFVLEYWSAGQNVKNAQPYKLPADSSSFNVYSRSASLRIRVTRADLDSEPIFVSHTVYVPAPRNLEASIASSTKVRLTWTAGLPGAKTEIWFREVGAAEWQQSGQATTDQQAIVAVQPDRTYEFRLRSQDQLDPQEFAPPVTIRVPASAPYPVNATVVGSAIQLQWKYGVLPLYSEIWRRTFGETQATQIATTTELAFLDATAAIGGTYEYSIYPVTVNGRGLPGKDTATLFYPASATLTGSEGDDIIMIDTTEYYPVVWINGVKHEPKIDGNRWLVINGLGGNDYIGHDAAIDIVLQVYGGDGNDTIYGSVMEDRLYGEAGDDELYGGWSWDTIYGGDGNDYLSGGVYDDYVDGGAGNDIFTGAPDVDGSDEFVGGDGWDRVDYGRSTLAVGLRNGMASRGGEADKIRADIEAIYTGSASDTIYLGAGANEIRSGAGDDLVYSGPGNDTILAGDGNDHRSWRDGR